MKKNKRYWLEVVPKLAAIFVLAIFGVYVSLNLIKQNKNDYINISDLSEEFMSEYLQSYSEMANLENKENILIVTSMHSLKDTFDASSVVEAPNHQYYLYYDSEFKKDSALSKFSNDETIKVQENYIYEFSEEDTESASVYNSWGIEAMGLDHAKELVDSTDAANVTVAIIDTGLDMDLFNESFNGKVLETYNVFDPEAETMYDNFGHGSHVAGTIAEGTPDNVSILPVKISDGPSLSTTDILAAINYITYYEKADVINMSFGGVSVDDAEYLAIEAANQKNIISVAAAGNESTSDPHYPSSFDNTLSISAVDSDMSLADFSNYGDATSFAAPGVDILSINGVESGTSMATPHAVSAVAILKSFKQDISLGDTINILKNNTIDLGVKGWDASFGYGFIDFSDTSVCIDSNEYDCDELGIFEKDIPGQIEISSAILTPYNYGSLTNILASTLKITTTNGKEIIKPLGDFDIDEIEITGYDPYADGKQTVTVRYAELETNFSVANPDNYEGGWEYYDMGHSINISKYKSHNLKIKTLYFPNEINNLPVTQMSPWCLFGMEMEDDYNGYKCVNHVDVLNYTTVIVPENISRITDFSSFKKLNRFISLADEITVPNGAFRDLKELSSVEANILFEKFEYTDINNNNNQVISYASDVFTGDKSLVSVTLSNNNPVIPMNTFSECGGLNDIIIPNSVTEIGDQAFFRSGIREINGGENLEIIGDRAFLDSSLESFYAPATLTTIGEHAFGGTQLSSLEVSTDNPIFDSRDNSNAIIETATNRLIVGTKETIIPDTVETIASNAFAFGLNASSFTTLVIPEGVTTIESEAISAIFLQKVVLPTSLQSMSSDSFSSSGLANPAGLVLWVHRDSYAHEKAIEYNKPYVIIEEANPDEIVSIGIRFPKNAESDRNTFEAFQTINRENVQISLVYYNEETDTFSEPEEILEYRQVEYHPAVEYDNEIDSLRAGDNYVTVFFDDAHGYHNLSANILIEANKAQPNYTVPTGILADPGQSLSEINLPEGFSWMDETEIVSGAGEMIYYARFTPEDTDNYEIIENIPITINVATNKTKLVPKFSFNKEHIIITDPNPIDPDYITVDNLAADLYTISDIRTGSIMGTPSETTMSVEITFTFTLSDDAFEEYYLDGGLKSKDFTITVAGKQGHNNYVGPYDGEEHTISFNMDISQCSVQYAVTEMPIGAWGDEEEPAEYDLLELPKFTNIGTYLVWYQVNCENRQPIKDMGIVIISGIVVDPDILRGSSIKILSNSLAILSHKVRSVSAIGARLFFDAEGNEIELDDNSVLCTGYSVKYITDQEEYIYNIVVVGDLDGDGDRDQDDFSIMRQHLMGNLALENSYFLAGDISDDNTINSADLLRMKQHLIGTAPIE